MDKKDKKGQGDSQQKGDYPDEETREIVEEIESESKDKSEVAEESKDKDKDKSEEDEPSDEEKEEEKKKKEEEEEEKKEEEESKGKSKQLKKDDKRYQEKGKKVSFGRIKDLKKRVKKRDGIIVDKDKIIGDQKAEIEKLGEKLSKMSNADVEKKIGELAVKHDTKPEFIKDVLGLVKSQLGLPKDLKKLKEDLERDKEDSDQTKRFNTEFDKSVIPLLRKKNPKISDADVRKVRARLKKSAMTYPEEITLRMLYKDNPKKYYSILVKKKSSEETKGGGSRLAKGKKWEGRELTEEEIGDLSDKEFDQYSADMEKRKGGKTKINRASGGE